MGIAPAVSAVVITAQSVPSEADRTGVALAAGGTAEASVVADTVAALVAVADTGVGIVEDNRVMNGLLKYLFGIAAAGY